ncbi:MAG: hypothetical protein ACI9MR_000531 [Myxococcota bacterium]|jgi:hypothetical protein
MKGVIFNLLEDFICDGWGDETYDALMSCCPLETKGPFVGPGTYPDSDLLKIVGATCKKLGISVPDGLRAFGEYAFPRLVEKYPLFTDAEPTARSFLESVHDVIHVEVRKLLKNAVTPRFRYREGADGGLVMEYFSSRRLCALIEGFVAGVATHYATPIALEHPICMHDGHDVCEIHLQFGDAA